jgi:hypothetical protein
VVEFTEEDRDYIALATSGESLLIVVLQVREGKLLGNEVFQVSLNMPQSGKHTALMAMAEELERPCAMSCIGSPQRCTRRNGRSGWPSPCWRECRGSERSAARG